jgi:hypothetical protein
MLQVSFSFSQQGELETILVVDLLAARCIWGKGIIPRNNTS